MDIVTAIVLPIIAAFLSWVVLRAGRSVAKRLGMDPDLAVTAAEIVRSAVLRSEDMASRMAGKITGGEKMRAALAYVELVADDLPDLQEYLQKNAEKLAERILRSSLTPDDMTPH